MFHFPVQILVGTPITLFTVVGLKQCQETVNTQDYKIISWYSHPQWQVHVSLLTTPFPEDPPHNKKDLVNKSCESPAL